jgi:hypothetical protein
LSLISPKSHLYQRIEHDIDLDLIKQEIKQNAFDMNQMIRYLTDIMATLCAPVRDSEIQAIRQLVDKPVEQLKSIFHLLDNMSLDMANFRLRTLRRSLMPIAVDYEREKFAEMLSSGMIQLVRTKRWLTESCERCQNAAGHDALFAEAFVSLLQHPKVLMADQLPETLMLDAKRITSFQNELQANTIVAALLMLARNFGTISAQKQSELAIKLFAILEDKSTSIDNLTVEIERAVGDVTERREMIRNMVDKTLSHTDTVYSLLSRRIASVIKSAIQNKQFVNDRVITSNGLEHIKNNLQLLSQRIITLTQFHRQVYAPWYDEMISEALK